MTDTKNSIAKLERTQWPIGHGGFHTGMLTTTTSKVRYFFDCGTHTKGASALIDQKISESHYDFAVISHFDSDHVSRLKKANVTTIFLPYLTKKELIFNALASGFTAGERSFSTTPVVEILQTLNVLKSKIVMVRHRAPPTDATPTDTRVLPLPPFPTGRDDTDDLGDLFATLPKEMEYDGTRVISDSEPLEIVRSYSRSHNTGFPILGLRFYNHRSDEFSLLIDKHFEDAIGSKKFIDEKGNAYSSVKDFMVSIEAEPAKVIAKNKTQFKDFYINLLSKLKNRSEITPSNLSSLCMLSEADCPRWLEWSNAASHENGHVPTQNKSGWLLTGDLELTRETWGVFYEHFHLQWENLLAFNVPHHGSAIALHTDATHRLREDMHLLIPASNSDPKHPDPALMRTLERRHSGRIFTVSQADNAAFSLTTVWRGRSSFL